MDVVGTFTDRMHSILQKAEEEAAEIRTKARAAARADEERAAALRAATRAEEETARTTLADLVRQRDSVLAELTRVRGQLEGLLSGPTTRITLPTQESGPDRREAGAGQPLPGTPEPAPEPLAVAAGPSSTSAWAARTATGTAVLPVPSRVPGGAAEPVDEPDAPGGRTSAVAQPVSPAEETALMQPPVDEPEAAEADAQPESAQPESTETESTRAESTPAESTQMMEPPTRASDDADEPDAAPTQVVRSG
jgi:syndecan 1